MLRRDYGEFSQDCEKMVEGLRCLKEKITTPKARMVLEDLEDQVEQTLAMVAKRMKALVTGAIFMIGMIDNADLLGCVTAACMLSG